MPIERIIHIVAIAVLGIGGWGLGMYIRKKVLENKYLRIHLSKEEWLDDMDLVPIEENIDCEDNKEAKNPPNPTHSPMDNSSFFSLVQKTRSKPRRPMHTNRHQSAPTASNINNKHIYIPSTHYIVVHKKVNKDVLSRGDKGKDNLSYPEIG